MYNFAGTITIKGKIKEDLDLDYIEIFDNGDEQTIYLVGETDTKDFEELLGTLAEELGNIANHDLSFGYSVKVQIMSEIFDEGLYEKVVFEGADINFKEIKSRFVDAPEAITVREGDISPIFKNRKVIVDFLY